jgi:hypothetical protein
VSVPLAIPSVSAQVKPTGAVQILESCSALKLLPVCSGGVPTKITSDKNFIIKTGKIVALIFQCDFYHRSVAKYAGNKKLGRQLKSISYI